MKKYHQRRPNQSIDDPKEQLEIIRLAKHMTLALCHENEPYLVTVNFGYEETSRTFFVTVHGNNGAAASRSLASKEMVRTEAQLTFCSMSIGPEPSTKLPRLSAAAKVTSERLKLI